MRAAAHGVQDSVSACVRKVLILATLVHVGLLFVVNNPPLSPPRKLENRLTDHPKSGQTALLPILTFLEPRSVQNKWFSLCFCACRPCLCQTLAFHTHPLRVK